MPRRYLITPPRGFLTNDTNRTYRIQPISVAIGYIPALATLLRGGGYEVSGDRNYTAPGAAEQIVAAVIRRLL